MLKKTMIWGLVLAMLLSVFALAEESGNELGTMQVVNCQEWVSLRQKPSSSSDRLVKVPLGAYVFNCVAYNDAFIKCEYNNYSGYIMTEYLEKADAGAPTPGPVSTPKMDDYDTLWFTPAPVIPKYISMETAIDYVDMMVLGDTVLNESFSVNDVTYHLYAVRPFSSTQEMMYVAAFDGNLRTIWARIMSENEIGQANALAAFAGGTAEAPCAMLYHSGVGLQCIDLVTGEEQWTLNRDVIDLGSGICWCVDTDGTLYIAGYFGPDPVAISTRGGILWISNADDPAVYGAYRILLCREGIICDYESSPLEGSNLHYKVLYDHFGVKQAVNSGAN